MKSPLSCRTSGMRLPSLLATVAAFDCFFSATPLHSAHGRSNATSQSQHCVRINMFSELRRDLEHSIRSLRFRPGSALPAISIAMWVRWHWVRCSLGVHFNCAFLNASTLSQHMNKSANLNSLDKVCPYIPLIWWPEILNDIHCAPVDRFRLLISTGVCQTLLSQRKYRGLGVCHDS